VTQPEIRQPVALRTLHGIELAAVGTWKAATGETTFTAEDFVNALAALECPGVRNPVIKLGHDEDDPSGGVRWDGEPAVGWIANMSFDGAKISGDLTGMPAWLADADENGLSVLAAAYPDRSIEIWRPFVCQIGHLHPSVITALSLLGVAPPGVGVLKSMQDVYAAWTQPLAGDSAATMARAALSTTVTLAAAREPSDIEARSGVDFTAEQEQWDTALGDLLEQWPDISAAQRDELSAQITDAVDSNPDALGSLQVDSAVAAAALLASMHLVAVAAAKAQVAAGKKQGVTLALPDITEDGVQAVAEAVTAAMAAGTAAEAGRAAAQALGTGDGKLISADTLTHLAGLSDRYLRDQLGGALSAAQHAGQMAVLDGWDGAVTLYASELNDKNVCENCKAIDGYAFPSRADAEAAYGAGKFRDCLGGARCRGQLVAIFGSDAVKATIRTDRGGHMAVVKASVSVEDISRQYYESAGYSMYITAMHVDPLELIAADDSNGKFYRIPVELKGEAFTFGDPQEVAMVYEDVKAAAAALPVRFADRAAALLAAGKKADGADLVARDVSPAGAAIRKAVHKADAPVVSIDTDVTAPDTETPAAVPAPGPITNPEEASVDAAKMREALGLGPDASDAEVLAALTATIPAPPAATTPPEADIDAMATLAGSGQAVLIDKAQLSTLIETARKGEIAYNQNRKNERDTFLATATREGRIPPASLTAYEKLWDNDPEGTRRTVSLLARNVIPVTTGGFLGQEVDMNEADSAYEAMYGKVGA
jgi:hypothetical protein